MHRHPANCLRGPVSRKRTRWARSGRKDQPVHRAGGSADAPRPSDSDIRWELVERIRREIADGTYDTPEKLEQALRRLLEELEE
jgi:anti-sigma28 factor (negative regulator of flagellin synthesis)